MKYTKESYRNNVNNTCDNNNSIFNLGWFNSEYAIW